MAGLDADSGKARFFGEMGPSETKAPDKKDPKLEFINAIHPR